jgi:hypothetical protein
MSLSAWTPGYAFETPTRRMATSPVAYAAPGDVSTAATRLTTA